MTLWGERWRTAVFGRSRSFYLLVSTILLIWLWMMTEGIWLHTTRYALSCERWYGSEPLTIVHLSDLHTEVLFPGILSDVVRRTLEAKPDLIVVSGDFFNRNPPEKAAASLIEAFSKLSASTPVYAVLGNHDYARFSFPGGSELPPGMKREEAVTAILEKANVRLLVNDVDTLLIRGNPVAIAGIDLYGSHEGIPSEALMRKISREKGLRILLTHSPQTLEPVMGLAWDIAFAGHTHGGQIRFPLTGWNLCELAGHTYVMGVYDVDEHYIHVSRGIASLGGVRFNCPPEVAVFTITADDD